MLNRRRKSYMSTVIKLKRRNQKRREGQAGGRGYGRGR